MKANKYSLTVEEAWKRADLTCQLEGTEKAVSLYEDVLARSPKHFLANYQLGKILLERKDSRGVDYMHVALGDPALVISGCELLYLFYQHQGQSQKANAYRQQGQQHEERWQRALLERSFVTEQASFLPHNLPHEEVKQLTEQLARIPEVQKAYFVRQQVALFPEKPFYVLGIVRRFVEGQGANYQQDDELSEQLQAILNFSGMVKVVIFQAGNFKLKAAIEKVSGALIYRYGLDRSLPLS